MRLPVSALVLLFSGAVLAADPLSAVRRPLVQGDVRAALAALDALPAGSLAGKDAAMARCLPERFGGADPVREAGDLGAVLGAYRGYWRKLMLGQAGKAEAEPELRAALNAVLPDDPARPWDRSSLDATTAQVRRHLEKQGLRVLTGVTHPYYEFMAWREEETVRYPVALPEQAVTVPVVFMHGFVSRGWLAYASCERYGAGGWTAGGTLYAVGDRYDRASEGFHVSYLGHEGQHFADNRRFPRLEQPELEYRAKLAELVLSRATTRALVRQFVSQGQAGRRAPHAHAEYWLARHLGAETGARGDADEWDRVGDDALRAAALRLLERSSAAAGAATARLLPD